jgi:hypothetical protein
MNTRLIPLTDPLAEAQQQIKQLTELQRQTGTGLVLAGEMSPAKKYQVYANALLQTVRQDSGGMLLNDPQPLPVGTAALVSQVQQYATHETALRAPNLAVLTASQGEETVRRLVGVVLRQFTESVNIKNRVSLVQIHEMSGLVPLEFSDLSLTDLVLCLRQVKAGQYGPLYESFDTVKLGEFLRRYRSEKEELREHKHHQAKLTQSNLLGEIMAKLDQAPAEVQEGIRNLRLPQPPVVEGAFDSPLHGRGAGGEADIGVDNSALFADKPKPKFQRPALPTQAEYRQKIQQRLAGYLPLMDAGELAQAVDYYRSHHEPELAHWLEIQWKQQRTETQQKPIINHQPIRLSTH